MAVNRNTRAPKTTRIADDTTQDVPQTTDAGDAPADTYDPNERVSSAQTDKAAAAHDTSKKPSIREQLKQTGADLSYKDKSAPSRTRDKNNYLEV